MFVRNLKLKHGRIFTHDNDLKNTSKWVGKYFHDFLLSLPWQTLDLNAIWERMVGIEKIEWVGILKTITLQEYEEAHEEWKNIFVDYFFLI